MNNKGHGDMSGLLWILLGMLGAFIIFVIGATYSFGQAVEYYTGRPMTYREITLAAILITATTLGVLYVWN